MRKIGKFYIVSENEMDGIRYDHDLLYKYKVMAELDWIDWEEQEHEEDTETAL